jgi:CheY-like chemotaxis protein
MASLDRRCYANGAMFWIERFPSHPTEERPKTNPLILVVDDEIHCVSMLRSNFEAEGYRVESATDGFSGRQLAISLQPDLIVSDVVMPGVNGLAMVETLKERPEMRDLPVIFISGQAAEKYVSNEPGPGKRYALLKKPLDLPELNQLVRRFLV